MKHQYHRHWDHYHDTPMIIPSSAASSTASKQRHGDSDVPPLNSNDNSTPKNNSSIQDEYDVLLSNVPHDNNLSTNSSNSSTQSFISVMSLRRQRRQQKQYQYEDYDQTNEQQRKQQATLDQHLFHDDRKPIQLYHRQLRHRQRHVGNGTDFYYDVEDDDDYYTYDNNTYTTSVSIRVTPQQNYFVSWGILWSLFIIVSLYAIYQLVLYNNKMNNDESNVNEERQQNTTTAAKTATTKSTTGGTRRKEQQTGRRSGGSSAGAADDDSINNIGSGGSPESYGGGISPSPPPPPASTTVSSATTILRKGTGTSSNFIRPPAAAGQSSSYFYPQTLMTTGNTNTNTTNHSDYYSYSHGDNNNGDLPTRGMSSADETRNMFRKLLLFGMLARIIAMPVQIWTDPHWYQFVGDTLPEMIFASAWTLLVTFFVQLVGIATGTGTNASPGIVIQATAYVVYLFLIGIQLFNTVATILIYALLCCIYAALLGVVLYFFPRLISVLQPTLRRSSAVAETNNNVPGVGNGNSGRGLSIRLTICTLLCISVFLARTIGYARLVVMPPRRVYWWWNYGVLELLPSFIFLILMHPSAAKVDRDGIDPDIGPASAAPSYSRFWGGGGGLGFRRSDSGSLRRVDSTNSATLAVPTPPSSGGLIVGSSSGGTGGTVSGNSTTPSSSGRNQTMQNETTSLLKSTSGGRVGGEYGSSNATATAVPGASTTPAGGGDATNSPL